MKIGACCHQYPILHSDTITCWVSKWNTCVFEASNRPHLGLWSPPLGVHFHLPQLPAFRQVQTRADTGTTRSTRSHCKHQVFGHCQPNCHRQLNKRKMPHPRNSGATISVRASVGWLVLGVEHRSKVACHHCQLILPSIVEEPLRATWRCRSSCCPNTNLLLQNSLKMSIAQIYLNKPS